MSVQPSRYRPQLPPRESWGRTATGQGRPALARPIGRHVARFATDLRTDIPDALLVSVPLESRSVLVPWVERLEGFGCDPSLPVHPIKPTLDATLLIIQGASVTCQNELGARRASRGPVGRG